MGQSWLWWLVLIVRNMMIRYTTILGPWFSLGFHIDLQKRYIDIHFVWWIITIGNDYYTMPFIPYCSDATKGGCNGQTTFTTSGSGKERVDYDATK